MFCTWGAAAPAGGRAPGSACRTRPFALSQTAQRPFLFCFCLFFLCCFFSLPLFFSPLSFVCFYFLNEIYENSYFLNTSSLPPPLSSPKPFPGCNASSPGNFRGFLAFAPFLSPPSPCVPSPGAVPLPSAWCLGVPALGAPGMGSGRCWDGSDP